MIKKKKKIFFLKDLEFLGYVINGEGHMLDSKKIEAIKT